MLELLPRDGTHAGSLEDCWRTAFHISSTIGGDAGVLGQIRDNTNGQDLMPGYTQRGVGYLLSWGV